MAVTKLPVAPPSDDGDDHTPHQQAPPPASTAASLHQHTVSNASTATVDIEAWTVSALESLNIAPIARGTGNALSIPLDESSTRAKAKPTDAEIEVARLKLRNAVVFDDNDAPVIDAYGNSIIPPRRPPSRRDSMKKRDALLKGKEGSRQRRRWENDHLLHVPGVQPPQPTDWQIFPTHTVHANVPYQLAQYWDKGLRERVEERKAAFAVHRKKIVTATTAHHHQNLYDQTTAPSVTTATVSVAISSAQAHTRADVGKVPKDLRATAKRTPAVKSWLRVLEEPVRAFMVETMAAHHPTPTASAAQDKSSDEMDSEDEEIVFVGRNGGMRDGKKGWEKVRKEQQAQQQKQAEVKTGMVLDSVGEDEAGAFKHQTTKRAAGLVV
ncbi:R3H-associated N-terminal domain containing protein [Naviculisporaceae sp. PSN 640]